ncbi:MAG: hypothetical protein KDC98_07385, partial [Planctomycetes bacterium]|nr:hypothetical protein [Planctomycetota bacterium]
MLTPRRRLLLVALFAAPVAAQIDPDRLGAAQAVARGVELRSGAVTDAGGRPQWLAVLGVDPGVEGVRFELARAGGEEQALEPTTLLAQRGGAMAAINGGFFTKAGQPDGLLRVNG